MSKFTVRPKYTIQMGYSLSKYFLKLEEFIKTALKLRATSILTTAFSIKEIVWVTSFWEKDP
jgi:hypothetical protein